MRSKATIVNQPELFDTPKRAVILNIKDGRQNRDAGIKAAVTHADNEIFRWSEKGYRFLIEKFLQEHNGNFMCEDVRSFAAQEDFELPPNSRAWGGVMMKAKKDGWIEKVGLGPVRNTKAHLANAGIWIRIK